MRRYAWRSGQRARHPCAPMVSTMLGIITGSRPRIERTRSSHVVRSRRTRPFTAAFERSVTCTAPSLSSHVTHVSTVAKRRPVWSRPDWGDEPFGLGRRLVRHEVQPLTLKDEAVDHGAQILPTECWANRFSPCGVEDDGGGSLVGDPHTSQSPPSLRVRAASSSTKCPSAWRRVRPRGHGCGDAQRR